jgi:large subunit ribosomal protein L27
MAHKKAAGSAKNLRDSQPKYRGVKLFGGQKALAGNIIIRQNGSKYECGQNTYLAADFTIHATLDGVVVFKKKNFKRFDGRTYLKTVVAVFPEAAVQVEASKPAKKIAEKAEKKAVAVEAEKVAEVVSPEAPKAEKKAPAKKPVAKKEPAEKKAVVKKAPAKKAVAKKEE